MLVIQLVHREQAMPSAVCPEPLSQAPTGHGVPQPLAQSPTRLGCDRVCVEGVGRRKNGTKMEIHPSGLPTGSTSIEFCCVSSESACVSGAWGKPGSVGLGFVLFIKHYPRVGGIYIFSTDSIANAMLPRNPAIEEDPGHYSANGVKQRGAVQSWSTWGVETDSTDLHEIRA